MEECSWVVTSKHWQARMFPYLLALFVPTTNLSFVFVLCVHPLQYQAHSDPYGREALQVWWMREELHSEIYPGLSCENTYRFEFYCKKLSREAEVVGVLILLYSVPIICGICGTLSYLDTFLIQALQRSENIIETYICHCENTHKMTIDTTLMIV